MALFDNNSSSSTDLFQFSVDETAKAYLLDTARWARFLSVIGFVLLGLLLVAGVVSGAYLSEYSSRFGSSFNAGFLIAFYAVFGVLYFFPTYYLYKFATQIKPAVLTGNQEGFNRALFYLRNTFRFVGIIMLVILAIYALVFIIMIIALGMR